MKENGAQLKKTQKRQRTLQNSLSQTCRKKLTMLERTAKTTVCTTFDSDITKHEGIGGKKVPKSSQTKKVLIREEVKCRSKKELNLMCQKIDEEDEY